MNKYDIYLADVPYRDVQGHKLRPVLILNESAFLISALPITTKGKTKEFQVEIVNWEKAGLDKPSYITLEPVKFTDKEKLVRKIVKLSYEDIFKLEMRYI